MSSTRPLWGVALAFAGAVILAAPTLGRDTWPRVFDPYFYFFSTDMAPVEVTLHNPTNENEPAETFSIPRAYLIYAHTYRPGDYEELPATVSTNEFTVAILASDGSPFSQYFSAPDTRSKENFVQDKYVRVQISYVRPGAPGEDPKYVVDQARKFLEYVDEFEGFEHYRQGIAKDYFFDGGMTNGLLWVKCFADVKPQHLCTVQMMVSPRIVIQIATVDFRAYGGAEFLWRRIELVRKTMCAWGVPTCSTS